MSKKSSVFSSVLVVIGCLALAATNFSCNPASGSYTLNHRWMENTGTLRWEQDSSVLVIANNASLPTLPVKLSKGKYLLRFKANGTIAAGVLPHLVIRFAEFIIKDLDIAVGLNEYTVKFELPREAAAPITFTFDNDFNTATEDRNIFLSFPVMLKPY